MLIWRATAAIAALIFVVSCFILSIVKFKKNRYLHQYHADELFRETQDIDMKNRIYSTYGETRKYIRRYVIRDNRYEKSVICNYNEHFARVSYYIMCYSKKQKVIQILKITDTNTGSSSKIFNIKKSTDSVNVVIASVNDLEINSRVTKPILKKNSILSSLFSMLCLGSFLYVVRHIAIEIIGGIYAKAYFDTLFNFIGIGVILVVMILYFFLSYLSLRRRNFKTKNGGVAEYEFF